MHRVIFVIAIFVVLMGRAPFVCADETIDFEVFSLRRSNSIDFDNATPVIEASFVRSLFQPPTQGGINIQSNARVAVGVTAASGVLSNSDARKQPGMDVGTFIGASAKTQGTSTQQRNPVITDLRTRGNQTGQLIASGSYWIPARMDLDTMLSKIDSRSIAEVNVIKGPYAAQYGPGHNFVNFELMPAQRFESAQRGGITSFDFNTNGERWYGRQTAWIGGENWGLRVSYGHRVGSDYRTGKNASSTFDVNGTVINERAEGFSIPASYNSRDWELALGYDPSPTQHFDFHLLRLDQSKLQLPGLAHDIPYLETDGYELTYVDELPQFADHFEMEGWYNRTRFNALGNFNFPSTAADGDASSAGYRAILSYGDPDSSQISVGTDLIYLTTEVNEGNLVNGVRTTNVGPIPKSKSVDFGVLLEHDLVVNDRLRMKNGARLDWVNTSAVDAVPISSTPVSTLLQSGLDQHFNLWSVYMSGSYEVNEMVTFRAAAGHGERPPTLTELYATGTFMGILQGGLTLVTGNPQLPKEKLTQFDVGLDIDNGSFRLTADAYFAWIQDFITIEIPLTLAGQPISNGAAIGSNFVNTNWATKRGVELNVEQDFGDRLTAFGTLTYIYGKDLTRNSNSAFPATVRGDILGTGGPASEPLPGIPPLDSQIGLRFHDPGNQDQWMVEFSARIVDSQNRVSSLAESRTPGFLLFNVRGFVQASDQVMIIYGVENIGDVFYREHIDYRTFRGVFRQGRNFYVGSEFSY